ncbi:MAG: hypothetical protein M0038_13890 [Pseudomonadota bacterium]|nr:hypothetical protein [Pseudomonadota bacterium]
MSTASGSRPAAAPLQRTTLIDPMLRLGERWRPGGPGTALSPAGLRVP